MKHGVLNIRLTCLVNLVLTVFEQGHEKDALDLLSQYLDTQDLGCDKCIGCGQTAYAHLQRLRCRTVSYVCCYLHVILCF